MVSSTAARTSMKLIKACSFKTSLQFLCCQTLRRSIPSNLDVFEVVRCPPGLRLFLDNNLSWLFRPSELSDSASAGKRKRHDRDEFGCHSKKRRFFGFSDEAESSSSAYESSDSEGEAVDGGSRFTRITPQPIVRQSRLSTENVDRDDSVL